jgi:predicted 2-oxoglutarate/Fe(II)-dependent dioxygenase YbiX
MKYTWYSQTNFYEPHELDSIVSTILDAKTNEWNDMPANNKNVHTEVFKNTPAVEYKLEKLFQHIKLWNRMWFGYDLYSDIPPGGNFNVYSGLSNSYNYHADRTDLGMSCDSKLTAILNVSQKPYTGGKFEMFLGDDHHIESLDHPGTLLVFPSNYYHRVTPVISGERTTISFWFMGPNWK